MPKHALPYDEQHDLNVTIIKERKRVAEMAIEKERKRILDGLQKLRCEFDRVEHNCSYWKDPKNPPQVHEIVDIIEDFDHEAYFKEQLKLLEEDDDGQV